MSGNSGMGVWIGGGETTGTGYWGTYIGTQVDGIVRSAMAVTMSAISDAATNNSIGGSGYRRRKRHRLRQNDGVSMERLDD